VALKRIVWAAVVVGVVLVAVPGIDLVVSGWFHSQEAGFVWRRAPVAIFLHDAIQIASRVIGAALALGFLYTAVRLIRLFRLGSRQWLFLLLALVVGPGLVANVVLKDNWGRARPAQVTQFGGQKTFSPPLVMTNQCRTNCSFVAGDPASGFFLHSFAYVVAPRRRRVVLAGGIAAGLAAGLLRIGMGAHFFSDVLFAGGFMIATSALLHILIFGRKATGAFWRDMLAPPTPSLRAAEPEPQQAASHG